MDLVGREKTLIDWLYSYHSRLERDLKPKILKKKIRGLNS